MVRVDGNNPSARTCMAGASACSSRSRAAAPEFARSVAMHVAAMNPPYIKAADVPADFLAKEKEIELGKMSEKDKAKPAEILEKIIGGKVAKIINENTLNGQPYVLNTIESVGTAEKAAGADVLRCIGLRSAKVSRSRSATISRPKS